MERGNFEGDEGKRHPIVKYRDTMVICAKTAELINLLFELWTWVGRRKHEVQWEGTLTPHGEYDSQRAARIFGCTTITLGIES